MPYIKPEDRSRLTLLVDSLKRVDLDSAGELNYVITQLMAQYIDLKGVSYQTYNDLIGVLEGAKMELYRRKVAPYENLKKYENGDV